MPDTPSGNTPPRRNVVDWEALALSIPCRFCGAPIRKQCVHKRSPDYRYAHQARLIDVIAQAGDDE